MDVKVWCWDVKVWCSVFGCVVDMWLNNGRGGDVIGLNSVSRFRTSQNTHGRKDCILQKERSNIVRMKLVTAVVLNLQQKAG